MKSLYPNSTSLRATNCRASWELAPVGVEYLFMGNESQIHRQITEGNYDFRYLGISALDAKPQLNQGSGRYRRSNTVPI